MSSRESPSELLDRLHRERERPKPNSKPHRAVAITGGRDYTPTQADIAAFWTAWEDLGATEFHHGDARGVDRYMAAVVRRSRPEVKIVPHPADWNAYGKRAGPFRNREMLTHVSALIAFQGGRGTQDCINAARAIGLPTRFIGRPAQQLPAAHQHDTKSWTWIPSRAIWEGRCITCHRFYDATPEEAAKLEQAAADYADEHPLTGTSEVDYRLGGRGARVLRK